MRLLRFVKIKTDEVDISINDKNYAIIFNCSAIYQVYNQICAYF